MWSARVLVACAALACARAAGDDSRVVRLAQGAVRGHRHPGADVFAFYNIPYATAPQGHDKYKAPLPPPVWTGIRDAVDERIACPQSKPLIMMSNMTISPDCLIANIYVPDTAEKNLPVVVSVHGGGYQVGFGNLMRAPYQLVKSKKVIGVNFNYRLGVNGFLCLGTPDVPGNAGMKDQVALLRWVNQNIAHFGGNPHDVTIDGYSAGSSSVDLLLLSKSTRGLFNKAIPESGSNMAPWSVQIDPIANAKEHAAGTLGFDNADDFYALEEFYKNLPVDLLESDTLFNRLDNNFLFTPCIERDTGVERFLEDAPLNILKSGDYNKVPVLYGFANMEGLFRVENGYEDFTKGMRENFADFLPHDLQFESEAEKQKVAKRVKEFYFGDKPVGDDTILGYIDYYSDIMFVYSTLRSTTLQVEAGNDKIYLYEFTFTEENAPLPPYINKNVKVRGANHCAQSATVLEPYDPTQPKRDESTLSEEFKKMKSIMRELWLNFITTGEPVPAQSSLPAWPAARANRGPYMELALPPALRGALHPARAQLWDDIYRDHYRAPAPPPTPPQRRTEL